MTTEPKGFKIGLLEGQGGKISYKHFYQLIGQLQKTRSLDHINPLPAPPATLSEFDLVYIILHRGYKSGLDEDGNVLYTHFTDRSGWCYWLAGFACLRFPTSKQWSNGNITPELEKDKLGDTADISVALLPAAQKQGCGRFVVERLIIHAFDTLRISRVTASVVCSVRPSHSTTTKKQVLYNTKQLCWIFEKFGFKFEGISRGVVVGTGAVKGEEPVWHDVHRLSMLHTDYFDKGMSYFLSNTRPSHEETPMRKIPQSPWESMMRRQEEEKLDVESWDKKTQVETSVNDACENDDRDSDEETILGDGSGSDQDWDIPSDFDD
ncbi:hypothetical protein FRC11_012513 [Ceratobasidium sp. 423]|nr:hypothetical protein FRC11_012513 [Ceratobasidium sp. 423]